MCELLSSEKIDIAFLTETDINSLKNAETYIISGYKTVLPIKKKDCELVRIICLIRESLLPDINIRTDLMSCEFPSIWVDYTSDPNTKPMRIAGFYRVWTQDSVKNTGCQMAAIKVFTSQLEIASENQNNVIIMGDANLCAEKWLSSSFLHKKVASSYKTLS